VPGIFYRSDRTAGTDMPPFVKEEKGVSRTYRNGHLKPKRLAISCHYITVR